MELSPEEIKNILKNIKYPGFTRDIVSFGLVKEIEIKGSSVNVDILLPKHDDKLESQIKESVRKTLLESPGVSEVKINIGARETGASRGQQQTRTAEKSKLPDIKYYIAVASGKGGVGKSTVAVNLAICLSKLRNHVGLMDADIWGPSAPIMMGINEKPIATPEQKIVPLDKYGLKTMSIGFLIDQDETVIWRGPMVHSAVKQFIEDVDWRGIDYLVVDLPPGTGDAQLSLVQTVPLSGGLIVTTPQDVALIDVRRGIQMFRKLNVPVLGIVENMSYLEVPETDIKIDIFGRGGGRRMAEDFGVPFLGEIPIDPAIRRGGDEGKPIAVSDPESKASRAFMQIAESVLQQIEKLS